MLRLAGREQVEGDVDDEVFLPADQAAASAFEECLAVNLDGAVPERPALLIGGDRDIATVWGQAAIRELEG